MHSSRWAPSTSSSSTTAPSTAGRAQSSSRAPKASSSQRRSSAAAVHTSSLVPNHDPPRPPPSPPPPEEEMALFSEEDDRGFAQTRGADDLFFGDDYQLVAPSDVHVATEVEHDEVEHELAEPATESNAVAQTTLAAQPETPSLQAPNQSVADPVLENQSPTSSAHADAIANRLVQPGPDLTQPSESVQRPSPAMGTESALEPAQVAAVQHDPTDAPPATGRPREARPYGFYRAQGRRSGKGEQEPTARREGSEEPVDDACSDYEDADPPPDPAVGGEATSKAAMPQPGSQGCAPRKASPVRGDRSGTGGPKRARLTEEELNARMASIKLKTDAASAAQARAQADAASFERREAAAAATAANGEQRKRESAVAARKRADEQRRRDNAITAQMQSERERNRMRKLAAQSNRAWDADKDPGEFARTRSPSQKVAPSSTRPASSAAATAPSARTRLSTHHASPATSAPSDARSGVAGMPIGNWADIVEEGE